MKYLLAFLAGVLVGSAAALFLAPVSGEELRAELQTRTDKELKRANAEMRKALADLNDKFDETAKDVHALIEQAQLPRKA